MVPTYLHYLIIEPPFRVLSAGEIRESFLRFDDFSFAVHSSQLFIVGPVLIHLSRMRAAAKFNSAGYRSHDKAFHILRAALQN